MIIYTDHKINFKNKFILLDLTKCIKTVVKVFSDNFSTCALSVSYLCSKWEEAPTIVSLLASLDCICF